MPKPITKLGHEAAQAFRAHVGKHFKDPADVYIALFRPLWPTFATMVVNEPADDAGWRNYILNPDNALHFHGWVYDNHYGAWLCVASMFPVLNNIIGRSLQPGRVPPCPVPLNPVKHKVAPAKPHASHVWPDMNKTYATSATIKCSRCQCTLAGLAANKPCRGAP